MSIVVDLDQLGQKLSEYPYGYLLTTGGAAVKAVTVTAHVQDGVVVIPVPSRGSARNLAENATATLLCPPTEARGYSLIVDGTAVSVEDGFRLEPAKAVLHRPADHSDAATSDEDGSAHTHNASCGHDCRPI